MTKISVSAFMALAAGRSGHFCMESGLHSALWLDLDALFASPIRVEPFISVLADLLRPFRVDAVCGPLLGGAFLAQRVAQRIGAEFWYTEPVEPRSRPGAIPSAVSSPAAVRESFVASRLALVDDVMSAGSSLRATYSEVHASTDVIAVGSLLQLGALGANYFAEHRIPSRPSCNRRSRYGRRPNVLIVRLAHPWRASSRLPPNER